MTACPTCPTRDPVWVGGCGLREPGLSSVREGLSVGYGDVYVRQIEGQYIDITHVRPGRYVLVHRINADRRLGESHYGNDVSWAVIDLRAPRTPGGSARVRVLRSCDGRHHCRLPGTRRGAAAGALARARRASPRPGRA